MTARWPAVPLGEVVTRSEDWATLSPAEVYREVTVRLWGKGVALRREALGGEIKAARRLRVRAGQFILSRIDARNGAFGLVPPELDGAVVSSDFPVFDVCADRLRPEFLGWLARTRDFVDLCRAASEGTTNRVRLKEDRFLAATIALPSVAEQRRIVAKIDQLAAKIAEARGLRREALGAFDAVVPARLNRLFGNPYEKIPGNLDVSAYSPLGELATDVADGPHKTPIYVPDGIPFITVLNITSGRIRFGDHKYITPEDHAEFSRRAKAERGDVLISKDGTIGAPCYVDTDRPFSFFVSVALVKPRRGVLDGEYLTWALRAPYLQDRIRARSRGDMICHLVLREIRALHVPVLPLPEQRRIVTYLDDLQAKVDRLKALQAQTAAGLDALLPAILDRAFKGEL